MLFRTWSGQSNQLPQPRPGSDSTRLRGRLPVVPCFRGSSRRLHPTTAWQWSRRHSREFRQSVPESNDCQHRGGLKGRNQKTDVKKRADASDGLNLHRLSCSLNPIKNTTRTSLPCYFQPHICCVGASANSVKLSLNERHRLQQVILHEMFAEFQPIRGESIGIEASRDDKQ